MAIKKDQIVSMTLELKVENEIIESNMGEKPMTFAFGSGQLIKGLEDRMHDLNKGDEKTIQVPCDEAYGQYDDNLSETLPISDFEGINLLIGLVLEGEDEDGNLFKATVTEVTKTEVTVDYNHPLAGKDLEFTIKIYDIV